MSYQTLYDVRMVGPGGQRGTWQVRADSAAEARKDVRRRVRKGTRILSVTPHAA